MPHARLPVVQVFEAAEFPTLALAVLGSLALLFIAIVATADWRRTRRKAREEEEESSS